MKKMRRIDLYIIPLFTVVITAVILRAVALFTSFDSEIMHYTNKVAITISDVLTALACLGFMTYLFLGEKERELIPKSDNARSYIPSGLVSMAMLFMGAHCFGIVFGERRYDDVLVTLGAICGVLAFLSVVSFFLSVFIEQHENMYKAAFSISIVLFLALYSAYLFFNKDMPTNSPNKITDQLAYVSAAAFFLFESRIALGRAKWRGYVAFGLIATLLCAYSSIPTLIYYLASGYLASDSLIQSVLALAIAVLICSKVLQVYSLTPAEECDTAKGIERLAMMREFEMEENKKLSRAHDNNNVENDETEDAENYTFDIPMAETKTDFTQGDIFSDTGDTVQ